jgi:hypothetical protein
MRGSGSKTGTPPPRHGLFESPARQQLVDEGSLVRPGPQQPADALHVLAFSQRAADHDRDVGVGDVGP